MYVCTDVRIQTCIIYHIFFGSCVCVCVCVCVCARVHARMYVCMYVCMHTCMYAYVCLVIMAKPLDKKMPKFDMWSPCNRMSVNNCMWV